MITSSHEYMQRLQDIQNQDNLKELVMLPSDEPRFIIDANSRTISIPDDFSFLSVVNDHGAETIYFEIDRYFDQHDLSDEICVIQFRSVGPNGDVNEGFFPITKLDIETVPGKILFGWTVLSDATKYAGDVKFSVRFYSIETENDEPKFAYDFNTVPATLPIKNSLNTTGEGAPVDLTAVETMISRFADIERRANDSIANTAASRDAAAVSAKNAATSESNAQAHMNDAQTAMNTAREHRDAAEAAAEKAKEYITADATLTISGAPADAAVTGEKLNDRYTKAEVDREFGNRYTKTEVDNKIASIVSDKTLNVEGGFADAKAVGDRLTPLEGFAGGYLGIWTIALNTDGWISKKNWTEHVDMAGYNYQCIVELPSATVATIPFAVPTPETFSTAITAGLAGVCETKNGSITF